MSVNYKILLLIWSCLVFFLVAGCNSTSEYRKLLKEDVAPLLVLKNGMHISEVQAHINGTFYAKPGAPKLIFKTKSGYRGKIYFSKSTGEMNICNVYIFLKNTSRKIPLSIRNEFRYRVRNGEKITREDVVKRIGLPNHFSAILNSAWHYDNLDLYFRDDILYGVEDYPPRN